MHIATLYSECLNLSRQYLCIGSLSSSTCTWQYSIKTLYRVILSQGTYSQISRESSCFIQWPKRKTVTVFCNCNFLNFDFPYTRSTENVLCSLYYSSNILNEWDFSKHRLLLDLQVLSAWMLAFSFTFISAINYTNITMLPPPALI